MNEYHSLNRLKKKRRIFLFDQIEVRPKQIFEEHHFCYFHFYKHLLKLKKRESTTPNTVSVHLCAIAAFLIIILKLKIGLNDDFFLTKKNLYIMLAIIFHTF